MAFRSPIECDSNVDGLEGQTKAAPSKSHAAKDPMALLHGTLESTQVCA